MSQHIQDNSDVLEWLNGPPRNSNASKCSLGFFERMGFSFESSSKREIRNGFSYNMKCF